MQQWVINDLQAYKDRGVVPGNFLQAVLHNDLMGAVRFGDDEVLREMREIIQFIRKELPAQAYGSQEEVKEWIKSKRT